MSFDPIHIRSVIVPLDGSPLAEQALPAAEAIAQRAGAKIKLVLVHQPNPSIDPEIDYVKLELAMLKADRGYLKSVVARLRPRLGRSVTSAVIRGGPVGETLSGYARELGADLIVLTTHGRGGIRRAWLGSVADQLIRSSEIPVLVIRPGEAGAERKFGEIMVPLDGSDLAEAVLEPVAELARLWDSEISLIQVVRPIVLTNDPQVAFPVGYSEQATAIRRDKAHDYVRGLAERLRSLGIKANGTAVIGGDVAETLIDLATPERVGMIALATHGSGGAKRLVLGSVADKLVRGAAVPVLVVRPTGKRAKPKSRSRRVSGGAVVLV
jgi:nucleotide-binding universal stress UspA family protein